MLSDKLMPLVIAVIGLPRTGTSCIAGVLHKLGIAAGTFFSPPNLNNPKGNFEDMQLKRICCRRVDGREKIKTFRYWAAC